MKKHRIADLIEAMIAVLADPTNQSRQHDIRKLIDVAPGEGQWRIRQGHYRLRYDIDAERVVLRAIKDRKEAYR